MKRKLASLTFAAALLAGCGGGEDTPELTEEERLALPANPANGRAIFKPCAVCHNVVEGTGHRVGPNLWGVVGADAGRHGDFRYSRALASSDLVWTEDALDAYIEDPGSVIPGGRMSYQGNPSPADRRDIIAYLKTLASEG